MRIEQNLFRAAAGSSGCRLTHFLVISIIAKYSLGHLAELTVKALNDVGSVNQSADLLRVLEIGAEIDSVGPSGLGDFRVFLVPALPIGV